MIPTDISIPICIEQGSVYHYEVKLQNKSGGSYVGERFFIVLNSDPKTDRILLMSTVTTQIKNQQKYIKFTGADKDTLVYIDQADYPRLSKESVVNCNNIYEITLGELINKVNKGGKIFQEKLPKNKLNELIKGAMISDEVTQEQKQMIV